MQGLIGLCRHFRSRWGLVRSSQVRSSRRKRVIRAVAAEVERLESRQLLSVTYHGGALLTNVEAQNVFLGSDWKNIGLLNSQQAKLNAFTATMVQSGFMDGMTLAGYHVYRGTSTPGVVGNFALDKTFGGGITDAQIQADLQSMIRSATLQPPDSNRLYIVFVEPGVEISMADGTNSVVDFAGYHGAFAGKTGGGAPINIHYAVIAYPSFPNGGTTGSTSLGNSFNTMTTVASHELAESITDPDVTFADDTGNLSFAGWFDDATGEEVGDIVQDTLMVYRTYEIQSVANQAEIPISFNAITQTLTGPTGVTLSAGKSPNTGVISWNASPLAEGYRVYSVSGTTRRFLGSTNALSLSFPLPGLTPGVRVSFQVEAFDGTFNAESAVVSGAAPFPVAAASSFSSAQKPTPLSIDHGPVHVMPEFFDSLNTANHRRRF